MATVSGTSSDDYVHPNDGTTAPTGYIDDPQHTTDGDDSIDASQGGTDYIIAGGGNDLIYMGGAMVNGDVIDGGTTFGDADTLSLAGNYVGFTRTLGGGQHQFVDTSLTFTQDSFKGIDDILLGEGSGFQYKITLGNSDIETLNLAIDASALTSAPLTLDATAVTQYLSLTIGTGALNFHGGTASNTVFFTAAPQSDQYVFGNDTAFYNTVSFAGAGAETFSLDATHFSGISDFTFGGGNYTVSVTSELQANREIFIQGLGAGLLNFSGAGALLTPFEIQGGDGDDTLTGGGGDDYIDGLGGSNSLSGGGGDDTLVSQVGNVVMIGGAGNDLMQITPTTSSTARMDGGAGSDTVSVRLIYDDPVTLVADELTNVDFLTLGYAGDTTANGHVFSATFAAGSVPAGEILPVDIELPFGYAVPIHLNASSVAAGAFDFTVNVQAALGNIVTGGGGNDSFVVNDPNGASGAANTWDGGGGTNTLDYSSDTHALNIDAVAGTATGSGAVPDDIAHFQIFKFGSGTISFNGGATAETIYADKSGTATIHGNGGNDVIYLGATLDAFDLIDGGANADTVVLDGNYAAGVTLSSLTLTNVETLKLQHLSGEPVYSYKLTMNDGNVAAGATLAVDGSALPAGGTLNFNGSAELDGHFSLRGGAGADTLTGGHLADTLNGGAGADSMVGGAGNDLFYVDNAGDKTIEVVGGGTDTVFASTSYTLIAGQSIELLATTSRAGTGAINLTGNELDQRIDGNYGNNVLRDGGSDSHGDTLYGFAGNDTFYVSNAADKVFEATSDVGSDTVFASVSYTLQNGQSVEYLATTSRLGTGTITLTGNEQAQRIDGNYGVNGLYGGDGNDTLYGFDGNDRLGGGNGRDLMDGGNGNDIFTYSAVIQSTGVNRDLIQNMNFAQDKFDLPAIPTGIDTKVIVGTLNEASFDTNLASAIGAGQLAAHHAVLFDPSAGTDNIAGHMFLIVDVNGVAGYQAGADYVIELQSATGTLTLGDFT